MSKQTPVGCGGFFVLLAVTVFGVFLYLKLAGVGEVAAWSWWWITSPLWLFAGLVSFSAIVFCVLFTCASMIAVWMERKH